MIKDLIETSQALFVKLDKESYKDKVYPVPVCVELERLSIKILNMTQEMKNLEERYG